MPARDWLGVAVGLTRHARALQARHHGVALRDDRHDVAANLSLGESRSLVAQGRRR